MNVSFLIEVNKNFTHDFFSQIKIADSDMHNHFALLKWFNEPNERYHTYATVFDR